MSEYDEQIKAIFDGLKFFIFSNYYQYIDLNKSFAENLYHLGVLQNAMINEKMIKNKVARASFPYLKTLDQFEYTTEMFPKLSHDTIMNLSDCNYINEKHNIIMISETGKGKTHLAIALGYEAIKHGYNVRFFTAETLINKLIESKTEKALDRALIFLNRYDLLIIDEFRHFGFNPNEANLIFSIINRRNERKSTIITTNYDMKDWGKFGWDMELTVALVDRLVHHSYILDMTGYESYRITHALSKRVREEAKNKTKAKG
jgi:DNA replication protein DnaC